MAAEDEAPERLELRVWLEGADIMRPRCHLSPPDAAWREGCPAVVVLLRTEGAATSPAVPRRRDLTGRRGRSRPQAVQAGAAGPVPVWALTGRLDQNPSFDGPLAARSAIGLLHRAGEEPTPVSNRQ